MTATGVETVLVDLLVIFALAGTVAAVAVTVTRIPYPVALLLVGLAASLFGAGLESDLDPEVVSEIILLVLVPALLFQGASRIDFDRFRANVVPIVALAVVGLLVSVGLLGLAGTVAFDFPLLVALLFAGIVLPTDPVAVLAIFEDLGAPERLSVIVDCESMLNDGVGVVLYGAFLGVVLESFERGVSPGTFLAPGDLLRELGLGIVVAMAVGLGVGVAAGSIVYRIVVWLDDGMTTVILTFVLAYGSFLLSEDLGGSGVVAVVGAGLFLADRGEHGTISASTRLAFEQTWSTVAFVANTFLFLLVGIETPVDLLAKFADSIVVALVLVFLARAVVVYPLVDLLNRRLTDPIPLSYQHVLVWSGIHVSIPLALVLGLPETFPAALAEEFRALVFGVAALTLVVQGLSMHALLDRLGLVERTEAEDLYELLVGRLHGVDAALAAADDLHEADDLPGGVYDDVVADYERERARLDRAIDALLEENPDLKRQEVAVGQRRVVTSEKAAIEDAIRTGVVDAETGERLLDRVDEDLERLARGEPVGRPAGDVRETYWERRAAEYGLDLGDDSVGDDPNGN